MPRNLKADSSKPRGTFHSFFSRGKFGRVSKEKNLLDGWVRTMQGAASAASEGAAAAPVKLNSQKRSMDHAERCTVVYKLRRILIQQLLLLLFLLLKFVILSLLLVSTEG